MVRMFHELKRRNVIRVGIAYLVAAWLLLQITDILVPILELPVSASRFVLLLIVIGLVPALIFAWAYELTPEGIKRESDVDRTQSITHSTGRKLDRVTIIVLVAAVSFLLVDKFMLRQQNDITGTEKSIAVLPFVAMSTRQEDEFFADGLTEEVINALAQVPELQVTARTSAFYYKGKDIPITEIAIQLGVDHVIEGSVRRDGKSLRITAQLVRAEDGFHLWSDTYDRNADDHFSVQTEIAEKVVAVLDLVLDEGQRLKMRETGLRNIDAFIAYRRGLDLSNQAHGAGPLMPLLDKANKQFETALALAPNFSEAYGNHADYYTHLLLAAAGGEHHSDQTIADALSQLQSDMDSAVQYAPEGGARLNAMIDRAIVTGRWRRLAELVQSLSDYEYCEVSGWADVTVPYGLARHVLRELENKRVCDPMDYQGWQKSAEALMWLGEKDASVSMAVKTFESSPNDLTRDRLILSLIAADRIDDAEVLLTRDFPDAPATDRIRFVVAAARGDIAAVDIFFEAFEEQPGRFRSLSLAAQKGDRELANKIASEIDARAFGYFPLLITANDCVCGAAFDIDAAPNFASMIEDSGLQWPPPSPIKWPLKNW